MKNNHKVEIDMLKLFKTGKFDFLKMEQSKEWILNNFPDPNGLTENPKVYESPF